MRHTDKDFWLYACAYVLLGSSFGLLLGAIFEYAFFRTMPELGSAGVGLVLGTFWLTILKRRRNAEQIHDNTREDGNAANLG